MEYDEKNKPLEACEICMKFNFKKDRNYSDETTCGRFETSSCLYKDRAIIVLLDRLLKKLNN